MPIDFQGYNNSNKFLDYQKLDQEFQLKKQLAAQQLQTGGIDAASKANIYKTQLLSGAVAGGQPAYDQARATLQSQGIDTSEFAPDVGTATAQVNAARLAQAPAYQLLNTALKVDSNNIQRNTAAGDSTPPFNPAQILGGGVAPAISPIAAGGASQPAQVVAPSRVMSQGAQNNAVQAMTGFDNLANANAQPAQPANAAPAPLPQANTAVPRFNPPPYDPSKTAAFNAELNKQAFEQFKLNNSGALKAEDSEGTKTGEAIGEADKTLKIMQSNLPQVLQRFQRMRDFSTKAGYGTGNNNEGTGVLQEWHNNFDNSETADANAVLKQAAAQGILPELGPQLAQAGIKGNKFLETLASSASGLDLGAPPSAKKKAIDGLENTYISNLKSTAGQLRARGQAAPSDAEIDAAVAKLKADNPTAAAPAASQPSTPKPGTTMQGTDGTYLFNGGDPAKPESWKKVK